MQTLLAFTKAAIDASKIFKKDKILIQLIDHFISVEKTFLSFF